MSLFISFVVSAVDNFSQTMNKLDKQMNQSFNTAGKLGTGMAAAGVGMAAGLGFAVKTAADFEKQMSRVGALSGASDQQLEQLKDTAKDLGATTAFSASQAAQGMQFLSMAGYETNDIISAMPGLLSAAAAGQTDLATTADITSNILSGFGMEASKTGKVADVLTKTFTSANVDMAMLGDTMKYVAPIANASGQSLEQMAAATGILGNAGIQGSKAGTALRMTLVRLADPPKEAADAMSALGFSASDSEGNMKPLSKVVSELSEKTKGMTQAQKLSNIAQITGTEAASAMLALMDAGGDTIGNFADELSGAGGTANDIANEQLDNLSGQLTILKSGLEGAANAIGDALLPFVKSLARGVQSLVTWFNSLNPMAKKTIAVVLALTTGFLVLVGPLLILIAMIPAITSGFAAIAGVFGVTSGVLLSTIGIIFGVITALAAIGVALYVAYKKVDWFRNMVDSAWAWIKDAWNAALTFIVNVVKSVMTSVASFISGVLGDITAWWDENGKAIMEIVKYGFSWIQALITVVMGNIKGIFQIVWPIITGVVKVAWALIKAVISTGVNVILGIIGVFAKVFTGDWAGAFDTVKDTAKRIWKNIVKIFKDIDLAEIGKDIIRGLINGIASMGRSVGSAVSRIVKSIPSGIKKFLGIASPSKVTTKLGEFTGEGLAVGMANSLRGITKSAGAIASAAVPDIGGGSSFYMNPSGYKTESKAKESSTVKQAQESPSNLSPGNPVIIRFGRKSYEAFIEDITQEQHLAGNRAGRF